MAFDAGKRNEIIAALEAHGVNRSCPRCEVDKWTLLEGFLHHPISDDLGQFVIGGKVLPTVALICSNCGYISEHAAVILGLTPPSPTPEQQESTGQASSSSAIPAGEE